MFLLVKFQGFLGLFAGNHDVLEAAGLCHLLGIGFFGKDYGVINLVFTLHFDDDIGSIFFLDEEVRIVSADAVGDWVDVVDDELGLAIGEHTSEPDLFKAFVAKEIPKHILFRL